MSTDPTQPDPTQPGLTQPGPAEPDRAVTMPGARTAVRPARPEEVGRLLPVCVEAFADEAVSAWVEPDPNRRVRRTRELLAGTLRDAAAAGELLVAHVGDEAVGASLWHGPRSGAETAPALPGSSAADRRIAAVLAATAARHPAAPHLYLSAMGTLPRRRGLGAGSAMLRAGLRRARSLDLPVYLEASTPRNRALYARHGFRDLGTPVPLPDGGPVLQPMWCDLPDGDGQPPAGPNRSVRTRDGS
ncbi:GNAT family N-acetyltransferase [Promicromonospora thailandica]|uniref:Acetyltransferase (GNAT) domain-containing protein n=1 Tax=Promicromonospora thailandica TaxID=765201 RepID=A0A9X2G760_9MICO|nr:GNAT family N-acetyltransferase [Promicromonospora thailandica]MCP2266978.1 Acetyltransferase (GNAT) domain-containing protein [Promicromonospora thailandica]BFF16749.1 hypothetical protein GCM10025730_02700 [Promicromonospora thailandica]